jgi:hypothetical protein
VRPVIRRRRIPKIADGQWVWPARGIVMYVGRDHKFANRIALFHATDLTTYQATLEPDLRSYDE